jgi:hypothetical protein
MSSPRMRGNNDERINSQVMVGATGRIKAVPQRLDHGVQKHTFRDLELMRERSVRTSPVPETPSTDKYLFRSEEMTGIIGPTKPHEDYVELARDSILVARYVHATFSYVFDCLTGMTVTSLHAPKSLVYF